jgi:hypothetical protein
MHSEAPLGWEFVMSKIIVLKIHSKKCLRYWNIILWIQWSHASYTYIKFLEGFSACCHELLLLMQVTELDIFWKMFVLVDRSLVASNEVIIPTMSLCSGWTRRISGGMCANCKEFLQQRCVSHVNLIMGSVVGKLTVSGAASVCTLQWNPHLMFCFSDPKWILWVLHTLHLVFSSLYCPNALFPKETVNMGFTVISYALTWTLSC